MKKRILTFLTIITSIILLYSQDSDAANAIPLTREEIAAERSSYVMVNPEYSVTPGDQYKVSYIDSSRSTEMFFNVEGDYSINLGFFGNLVAKGYTYWNLKKEVELKISQAYPSSTPNMKIVEPGEFEVQIVGEIKSAALVKAWSFDRLSTLLAGKIDIYASTRFIEVKKADGSSRHYDLFKASKFGFLDQDPFIQSGDTIILHPSYKRISIYGEVQYPGQYEMLPDETLGELIDVYASGYTTFADKSNVTVKRISNGDRINGDSYYLDLTQLAPYDFSVEHFDNVTIGKTLDYQPLVFLQGAVGNTKRGTDAVGYSTVSNKLKYRIVSGQKLSTMARELQDSFGLESDLENSFIIRSSDGSKLEVDIENLLLKGGGENDATLYDGDTIVIPFKQYLVYVGGQVNNPGAYPFIVNKTYEYYVGLAGGFNINNHIGKRVRITDVYGNRKSDYLNRIIEPEDVIYAPLNSPIYWLKEYGDDIAVIATSLVSTAIVINYLGNLVGNNWTDLPTYSE